VRRVSAAHNRMFPTHRHSSEAMMHGVTSTATTDNQGVDYFTFDLGLSLHSPFGR